LTHPVLRSCPDSIILLHPRCWLSESACAKRLSSRWTGHFCNLLEIVWLKPRLHDEASSTSWLVEPASSSKQHLTVMSQLDVHRITADTVTGGAGASIRSSCQVKIDFVDVLLAAAATTPASLWQCTSYWTAVITASPRLWQLGRIFIHVSGKIHVGRCRLIATLSLPTHWQRPRHRRSQRGPEWEKNIKAIANLTVGPKYALLNDKQYQTCYHQIRFLKLKMHQNLFSAGAPPLTPLGELTTLVGCEIPSPFPYPLDAFGVANSSPRFAGPLTQNPGYASGPRNPRAGFWPVFELGCRSSPDFGLVPPV